MGTTVIAPAASIPMTLSMPIVETKPTWDDVWAPDPELQLERATRTAAGHDLGTCELVRRYGIVKYVHDADMLPQAPVDLSGWWVRLRFQDGRKLTTEWIGQISNVRRDIEGADVIPTGKQTWVAYEPLQLLRKRRMSRSFWAIGAEVRELGWVPNINAMDDREMVVGNRTSNPIEGTYLFGGTDVWTRRDVVEYVLARFADDSDHGGAAWRLGGQQELLSGLRDTIALDDSQTVADVLKKLIPRELGIDFMIVETAEGFEVSVYALTAYTTQFHGATLPKNPNRVTVQAAASREIMGATAVLSNDQRYSEIRVLGRRIVVCATLWGESNFVQGPRPITLAPKWKPETATDYREALGSVDGEENDTYRRDDRFRNVYRLFGAPVDWDRAADQASPYVDDAGVFANGTADYQNIVLQTLPWLPLQEGVDYSSNPPESENPAGHVPDFLPPAVWLYDETAGRYVLAEEVEGAAISVSVAHNMLGFYLSVRPNHILALGEWDDASASDTEPLFDHQKMMATLAFEADHRLEMRHKVPDADGDGSVMEVMTDAEMWILAPKTVVGVYHPDSVLDSGEEPRVLRNDSERMAFAMAGAIARYYYERGRATINMQGCQPWSKLLGKILTTIEEASDSMLVDSPVTSVEWTVSGDRVQTTIRTGFAG